MNSAAGFQPYPKQLVVTEKEPVFNDCVGWLADPGWNQTNLLGADHDTHRSLRRFGQWQVAEFGLHPSAARLTIHKLRVADKCCDLLAPWPVVQRFGRIGLEYLAIKHHGHMIGQTERLLLIVRDQNRRRIHSAQQLPNFDPQMGTQFSIEAGERFIQKQDFRFRGQCPSQRDPLLLPAAQFMGHPLFIPGEANHPQAFADVLWFVCGSIESEGDIAGNIEMTKKRALLEDHADMSFFGPFMAGWSADYPIVERDRADIDLLESSNQPEHCRFAAPTGTEQGRERTHWNVEINAANDRNRAEALGYVAANEYSRGMYLRLRTIRL